MVGVTCNDAIMHTKFFNSSIVHGGWSSWKQSPCSKTCGGGIVQFTRTCSNPTPSCGGASCRGISVIEEACNEFCCRGKIYIM